jgi:ketosteroid isomerase-like protein
MRCLLLLVLLCLPAFPQSPEADVHKIFDDQIAAWNHGDLEAFMRGYWKSPKLTFFGNNTETHGWEETLSRYRQRYQAEGKEMGKLDFKSLNITPLGNEHALARGRWHLVFKSGKEATGMTTLVLQKMPEGWRIIHDHSSGE